MAGRTPPPAVAAEFDQLAREGERNWVQNLDRIATGSLRSGNPDFAAVALDESGDLINAIFSGDPAASRARSLWFDESSKVFKGEPFERVMVFLYRGVLYMQAGDLENARACFRNASQQDSFAEEEQNRSDWVSPDLLTACCEYALEGRKFYGDEALARARKNFAEVSPRSRELLGRNGGLPVELPRDAVPHGDDNLVVVAMLGSGPRKVPRGEYDEALGFEQGTGGGGSPEVLLDGHRIGWAVPVDSLSFQAMTRGGRPVDQILKRKAVFKKTGETAGNVALAGGLIVAAEGANRHDRHGDDMVLIGLIIAGVGAVITGIAYLISPRADLRAWEGLPENVNLLFAHVQPGEHRLRVGGGTDQVVNVPPGGQGLAIFLVP